MGKFTAYKLQLRSIPEGIHEYEYQLGKQFFADMESADIHDADLVVKLTVTHKRETYHFDFKITGEVTLTCDRCLDYLPFNIEEGYEINVKYGDEYNDESDDLLIIPEGESYLNTAYMIYDTVALAIPIKHVHAPGKCNHQMSAMLKKHRAHGTFEGLDPEDDALADDLADDSSVDTPTDSRWDALKGLNLSDD